MKNFLKILHLEDSEVDAELVLRLLKNRGFRFECLLARNKKEFLEALDTFEPNLIISDNALPQFSATEALAIVTDRLPRVPFILVTGTVSEEFAAEIIKLGADDFILKDRLARLPAAIETSVKKKEAEAALKRHEEKINFQSSLLATVGQAVIATDLDGRITYWNKAAENTYGWLAKEVIGKNIMEVTPAMQTKEQSIAVMQELRKGNSWSGEFLVKRKDGSTFPAFVTDSPIRDQNGNLTGIIGVSSDISGQKKAEQAVKNMEMKMLNQKIQAQKKISRAMIKAQEEERSHIGKELHDNINQLLAGVRLYLTMAAKSDTQVKKLVKYPIELLDNSIEEIRMLSAKCVTTLRNIDLKKLVGSLVASLNKSASIETSFSYNITNPITDDELKLNIYRIIQELVNNIIKHALASHVTILIEDSQGVITVEVKDDGNGFDSGKKSQGIGISNIMDRTESFNGTIKIETSKGNGCKVQVTLPLHGTHGPAAEASIAHIKNQLQD